MVQNFTYTITDKTVLGKAIISPPYEANLLSMEGEARIVYVVKGKSILHSPVNTITLTSGSCAILSSGKLINNWLKNEDSSASEIIIFRIYPDIIRRIYDHRLPDVFSFTGIGPEKALPVYKLDPHSAIDRFIESIQYYFGHPTLLTEELISIKLKELLFLLMNVDGKHSIQSILQNLFTPRESEFTEVIHANIFQDLSLDELAFLTNMSTSSFKRKFKMLYGTSPIQYFKTKRLERAKHLLESTNLNVSEIAYDTGFNDRSYFTKAFTTRYKLSPSAYRNSL